jgi:hypothetical protein
MKLIKKLIEKTALAEEAAGGAVGAGAVAAHATPLFAQLSKHDLPTKVRVVRSPKKEKKAKKGLGLKEGFYSIQEDQTHIGGDTFDTNEVIAKLKALENKNKGEANKYDTQAFALEDEDGNIVKVRVRREQASNFEGALNAFLQDLEDDEDGKRGVPEIAELLFKLKDRFDIVDVEWPEVPEDQEEGMALAGGEPGAEPGAEGGEIDLQAGGEPGAEGGELDLGADVGGGGEEDVKGLLVQVIDMMKADAEARKAEAHAKAAEAKAKEAELATQQIYAKVKQEEQILDMETHTKKQKEAEKEAKRLAQLARWKHEMERDEGASFDETPEVDLNTIAQGAVQGGREEEETHRTHMRHPAPTHAQPARKAPRLSGRVRPTDVASYILGRIK